MSYHVVILIPCHNYGHLLQECLDSVVAQDYQNKSICVVNDGSTDNTNEILDGLIKQGKYQGVDVCIVHNKKPLGPSAARNIGIKTTFNRADAYAMLDADDRYLPGKLSRCVPPIEQNQSIGLVYNDVLIRDIRTGREVIELREPYNRQRLEQECIICSASVVSKLALQTVGLYDEEMRTCEDWDLWLRITERFMAIHIPEILHVYSVTGFNSSNTVNKEIWEKNWQRVSDKLQQRRNSK